MHMGILFFFLASLYLYIYIDHNIVKGPMKSIIEFFYLTLTLLKKFRN